jgi:hypothetical protein
MAAVALGSSMVLVKESSWGSCRAQTPPDLADPRRALSSPAAARKGNGVWVGSGGIQRACELHWGVARLLV